MCNVYSCFKASETEQETTNAYVKNVRIYIYFNCQRCGAQENDIIVCM